MAIWFLNIKHSIFFLCLVPFIFTVTALNAATSQLINSPSPYVAMHANDKIVWHEWNQATLLKSKKENKPLFLSLGYFSCYWCHVLQRESFNNTETAKLVNAQFIPVIVDRELHASLDAHLIRFAEETLGRGGWPLNVIITPDGYPLTASLYMPAENVTDWLKKVAKLWRDDEKNLRKIAKQAADEMSKSVSKKPEIITSKFQQAIQKKFLAEVFLVADEFEGGFGDQSKFPLPSILLPLLNTYEKTKNAQLADFLKVTLNSIRNSALYDHLDGGYFRYTTDPGWQIPHFEKMLYDNAQIASLFFRAGNVFKDKHFTEIAIQQLDYLIEKFSNNNGGYYSSYSAIDDAGIEGGYYLWNQQEIDEVLSPEEKQLTFVYWDWNKPPLLTDGYFPVPIIEISEAAKKMNLSISDFNEILKSTKSKLKSKRDKRSLPRDEKLLTSWNALMLIALADGFQETGIIRFKNAADRLAKFISTKLIVSGELQRSLSRGSAELEDYAYTVKAFYLWFKISGTTEYKSLSVTLARKAWKRFWKNGGWQTSNNMLIPNLSRESMLADGPLPSASSIIIALGFNLQDEKLLSLSKNALSFGHSYLESTPFWYASYINLHSTNANK